MSNVNRWIKKLATLMGLTDCRRDARIPTDLPVFLSGPLGSTRAQCTDINGRGLAAHATEAVAPGTLVFLRLTSVGLAGFAHVRHCRAIEDGYVLGLEFREKLTRERRDEPAWNYSHVTPKLVWDEREF
jgi:hypothetical protein